MKHGIRRVPALWRATRLARRWYHARRDAYPDWTRMSSAESSTWADARRAAQGGRRVLMATSIGSCPVYSPSQNTNTAVRPFSGSSILSSFCRPILSGVGPAPLSRIESIAVATFSRL